MKKSGAKKATKKTAAKKATTKKSTAKKTPAKKAPATKKTAAKKSTAKKTPATKKAPAKKAAAKKAPTAKKTPAAKKKTAVKAGKPVDVAALIARIEANASEAGFELPGGASEAAIAGLEQTLGQTLPDDMKAFYRAHDGGPEDEYALENRELLSLERIAGEWKIWKDLLDSGTFEANDHGEPGPGVQKKWWIPEWVPVTYDGAGNHHVVDLAPAPGGVRGQVVSFWHDEASRRVVGPSFLEWLADAVWGEED